MFNCSYFRLSVLISFFLLILLSSSNSVMAQPKMNQGQLIKSLRTTPVWEHREIYGKYDTQLIRTKALRKTMIDIGLKGWYKRIIRPYELENVDFPKGSNNAAKTLGYYRFIVRNIDSQRSRYIELWIKLLSGGPYDSKKETEEMVKLFKENPNTTIKSILKIAGYEKANLKSDEWTSNREFRHLSLLSPIPRITYEVARLHRDKLKKGLAKRLEKFSWKVLEDEDGIGEWKVFSIAFLREKGVSDQRLEKRLFMPDQKSAAGGTIKGEFLIPRLFETVDKWRSEYPEWPIGEDAPTQPGKVTICHKPTFGVVDKPTTIEINRNALNSHLDHGDYKGPCEDEGDQ